MGMHRVPALINKCYIDLLCKWLRIDQWSPTKHYVLTTQYIGLHHPADKSYQSYNKDSPYTSVYDDEILRFKNYQQRALKLAAIQSIRSAA